MWALRVLSGPQANKIYPLKPGVNTIGRAPTCAIVLNSQGVSKEHASIEILPDKIIISDCGSTNGTFINGVQIKTKRLHPQDKIGFHEIISDVVPMVHSQIHPAQRPHQVTAAQEPYQDHLPANYDGNVAYQAQPHAQAQYVMAQNADPNNSDHSGEVVLPQGLKGLLHWFKHYVNEVALPGVYKLTEWMEFKWVMALFLGAFIVFVTSLSSIPLVRIVKSSVEQESQLRAMTIARTLARVNRPALLDGTTTAVSVQVATSEPGVSKAYIISSVDGNIVAPPTEAGNYPDIPFVHTARKYGKEAVKQTSDDTIAAIVPIEFYNSTTGNQTVTAYAVVIYDMGTLAIDNGQTLSLMIQTFFIALIVGGLLFFFMYKLIEFPFMRLNSRIDHALKERHTDLAVAYDFPPFQELVSNVTSLVNRALTAGDSSSSPALEYDRSQELNNLVQLIGFAAIAINAHDRRIAAVNPAFEERTGINTMDMLHQPLENLHDQALKLSLQDLLERSENQPDQIITNQLEFGGQSFELASQAVYGSDQVAYFLVCLLPPEEDGGEY